MDPNAALERIRELATMVKSMNSQRSTYSWTTTEMIADQLADAVQDLDGWLDTGGFLPIDWTRK
jgi:hypothetical protein